jgi:phosphatidate cytidylyltransferase
MPSPLFTNPFVNPIFVPVISSIALLFVAGFVILAILAKGNFSKLFESKVWKIFLGWLILAPLYALGIFLGRLTGLVVLFLIACIAIREVATIAKLSRPYARALVLLALVTVVLTSFAPTFFYSLPIIYFTIVTMVAIMKNDGERGFYNVTVSLFATVWILFGIGHFILLAHLNNTVDITRSLLLLVVFAVALSDIGAFIFGKTFEKIGFLSQYKIAPAISPNKTYIGLTGHIAGAFVAIWIMRFVLLEYLPWVHWVIIAILIGIFGLIGGLTNSMFKRYYAVKDSGNLIPGHGGILDRIDSSIRVVVILYYYLRFFL